MEVLNGMNEADRFFLHDTYIQQQGEGRTARSAEV